MTPEHIELMNQKAMMNIDYMFKRKKEKNDQPERILHKKICEHIQTYYPDVYFFSDPSGIKLSPNILKLLKATRSRHTQLDIVCLEPFTIGDKRHSGLILEVKAKSPYQKNGELFKDAHLEEQNYMIQQMESKGFKAGFVWELDAAILIFETCFGKPKSDNQPLF